VDLSRVRFEGARPSIAGHLAVYGDVDLALDTFPYNGATTTCESLWMGVPVLTLAGATHVSRVGASLLTAVGLDSLIAKSESAYIEKACALAADPHELSRLREGLRAKMEFSTLTTPAAFLEEFEGALRFVWRDWRRTRQL
jgi:protein O-GlcNAc transferase